MNAAPGMIFLNSPVTGRVPVSVLLQLVKNFSQYSYSYYKSKPSQLQQPSALYPAPAPGIRQGIFGLKGSYFHFLMI